MVTLLTKFNFEQRNYFHIFRGFGNLNALLPKLHTIFKLFFLFVINERFINLIGHFWCLISVFIYIYIVTDVLNRKEHSIESFIPYQFQRDGCFQGKACSHNSLHDIALMFVSYQEIYNICFFAGLKLQKVSG